MAHAAIASPVVAAYERFHAGARDEAEQRDGGLLLLNELNCVACHAAPEAWRERLPGRTRLVLAAVGDRMSEGDLRAFLSDPARFKPGTTMPGVVRGEAAVADSLAAYLTTLRAPSPARHFPSGDAARGRKSYAAMGCVACHAAPGATPAAGDVPLGLAGRYGRNALAAFLQDPLSARPDGRMPAFELSAGEAADLAAYLQENAVAAQVPDLPAGARGAAEQVGNLRDRGDGPSLFASRGCAACHDDGVTRPPPSVRPLAGLRPGEGCLAPQPREGVPDFSLSAGQRQALGAALRWVQQTPTPAPLPAAGRLLARLEHFNCLGCHAWAGRGGVTPGAAAFFTATDSAAESLGELGHLPPRLDHAGRKLTPAWLEKLLAGSGGGVRPYLSARMPRFGSTALDLVPLFAAAGRPTRPQVIDTSGTKGHQRFATGRQLIGAGEGGLGCVACHGLQDRQPPGVRAVNLTRTAQRIQPEYFKALLLDPQGIQPGTIMPPLLASRKNADKEIESIWTYLRELDQNPRLPEGLEPTGALELKPEREGRTVVFRTFLEHAGTHAIAVGSPSGLHAAFDSFEGRWGVVWRGRFLDALSNWEERAMPPIKPLGTGVRPLPAWMPVARLDSAASPWPAACGDAAHFVFRGYRIGADGVPVFRYRIADLEIEDVLRPEPDGAALRRTLTLRGAGSGWYVRGLGDEAPRPVVWREGVAQFEERVPLSPP